MSIERKYFGTDGIRGRVGLAPITPEFILKLGWAMGRVLAQQGGRRVLIGKDTRISGYLFESALEAGLSAAGVDIQLIGPMPTPAIAYLTQALQAQAGIVISASHNAYFDNGIKLFSEMGSKLSDAIEMAIEAELEKELTTVESALLGKASRVTDAAERYIDFCKSTFPSALNLEAFNIVVDCAHGATYQVAPAIFRALGAKVKPIHVQPNGLNINDHCGSTKPAALRACVLAEQADLGIAFDGDGDRVIFVDHRGEIVDGDELLFILADARFQQGTLSGGVVGTVMSNLGLEQALQARGIPFSRAQVGDRYVIEHLKRNGWILGGEPSGHLICLDVSTTGDGIVSALQVLSILCRTHTTLHALKSGMKKFPQSMVNVPVNTMVTSQSLGSPAIQAAVQNIESQLAHRGRVLLRPSGTETLVRVMIEGEDQEQVQKLAEQLAAVVSKHL